MAVVAGVKGAAWLLLLLAVVVAVVVRSSGRFSAAGVTGDGEWAWKREVDRCRTVALALKFDKMRACVLKSVSVLVSVARAS